MLMDWEYLDRAHAELLKCVDDEQQAGRTSMSLVKRNEAWKEFVRFHGHAMPDGMATLLLSVSPQLAPITKFALELVARWGDLRTEIHRLESDNAKLLAERHKVREARIGSPV